MRKSTADQRPLVIPAAPHAHVRELVAMKAVLDAHPEVAHWVHEDLTRHLKKPGSGREGLCADLVLRALVLKQMLQLSYDKLAFTLQDSTAYRAFCGLGIADRAPKSSALQRDIKRVRAETLEQLHWVLVEHARAAGIEKGRTVRFDCTVTETNILEPQDSGLLWDGVRVLTRLMHRVDEHCETPFRDRTLVSKRRALAILNAKSSKDRKKLYRELMDHTRAIVTCAEARVTWLKANPVADVIEHYKVAAVILELEHFIPLVSRVIIQTGRRIFLGETVPQRRSSCPFSSLTRTSS